MLRELVTLGIALSVWGCSPQRRGWPAQDRIEYMVDCVRVMSPLVPPGRAAGSFCSCTLGEMEARFTGLEELRLVLEGRAGQDDASLIRGTLERCRRLATNPGPDDL